MKVLFIKNKSLKSILLLCMYFSQSNAADAGDSISPLCPSISSFESTESQSKELTDEESVSDLTTENPELSDGELIDWQEYLFGLETTEKPSPSQKAAAEPLDGGSGSVSQPTFISKKLSSDKMPAATWEEGVREKGDRSLPHSKRSIRATSSALLPTLKSIGEGSSILAGDPDAEPITLLGNIQQTSIWKSSPSLVTKKMRPQPMRMSRRPACCAPVISYSSMLRDRNPKDMFLLFSCDGKTQCIATMAMASVFLDKLNKGRSENKISFMTPFQHIIGFASGSIPAAASALGYPLEEVSTKISPLPISLSVGASSIVSSPGWMIAQGVVKGFLAAEESEKSGEEDRITFPVQYDVFQYPSLYATLDNIFGDTQREDALRKLYIHSGSTNATITDQIMESIIQYDSKQAMENSEITKTQLISATKSAAELMGFDEEHIDKISEFFDKPESLSKFVPYSMVMDELYSGKICGGEQIMILSFSSRTAPAKKIDIGIDYSFKERAIHLNCCLGVPKKMYKHRTGTDTFQFLKDATNDFLSQNRPAAVLVKETCDFIIAMLAHQE